MRASWTANTPTPPAAPPINTVSCGPGSTTVTRVDAVQDARPVATATVLHGSAREPGLAWAPEPAPVGQ